MSKIVLVNNEFQIPEFLKLDTDWDDLRVPVKSVKLGGIKDPNPVLYKG